MRFPWLSRCQTDTSAPATGSPESAFRTKPFDPAVACPRHQRQVAHPHVGHGDNVVPFAELRVVAGGDEIEARLEAVGRRRGEGLLLVVGGGRQLRRPFQRGFAGQDFPALLSLKFSGRLWRLSRKASQSYGNGAEIHRLHIAVADGDVWPRRVPNALGSDAGRLGFNLGDQVAAELSARRLREQFRAAAGQACAPPTRSPSCWRHRASRSMAKAEMSKSA